MDKRCLLITYYFPPMGGGGVQRLTKLIKFASRWNWQFTVITADEQSSTIVRDNSLLHEIPPSTQIIRVPFGLVKSKKLSAQATYFKRWLSALFFVPDSRKKWVDKAWQTIHPLLKKEHFDLVFISLPPYSLSFLLQKIEAEFQVPVLLDLRDPWTLNPYKIHPTPVHRWLDWKMERKIIARARAGISAYQRLLDFYTENIENFKKENWITIPNGFDEEDFKNLESMPTLSDDLFRIGFSGTIYSHLNHPTPLFKAMATLNKRWPEQGAKVRFVHVGKSHIDLKKLASKFKLEGQVESTGYLSHQQALKKLNQMDSLCFILDDREARSVFTIGGKVYEYLRLKKPILALVPEEGEAADLIHKTKSGLVVSPRKTEKIVSALRNWISRKPLDFQFDFLETFRRDYQAKQFTDFFAKVIDTGD